MKQYLKLLISSLIITLIFVSPQAIHGMEDSTKPVEQKKPSGIQLKKVTDDTLEAVLGTGSDIMLRISLSLKTLQTPLDKEQLEVPVRLFLTDFTSSPTNHPAVDLNVKVDCESTLPTCVLPNKPQSFDSYIQFTDWMNQGYFMNQVSMTYDFNIDIGQTAPSLAQHLFAVPPGGYHFIGTHVIDNAAIKPDDCIPQISYTSQRGNTNTTTVTLRGAFSLNGHSYPIDNHQQVFPHPVIEQTVFKDETKKFYSHKWLAHCEEMAKITYGEFPNQYRDNWPKVPYGTYILLQQKPGDLEEIKHLGCWDGTSGADVDISDGRIFLIVCETANKERSEFLESIVKGDSVNLYTTKYQYSEAEKIRRVKKEERRQELEREAAEARKKVDVEQQMIKVEQEEELRERKAIFATRETMIHECINQYKVLTSPNLTYEQLRNACMNGLFSKYDARLNFMKERNLPDTVMRRMEASWIYTNGGRQWLHNHFYGPTDVRWHQYLPHVASMRSIIKEDVIEMVEIYEKLYGKPHPRKDEIS